MQKNIEPMEGTWPMSVTIDTDGGICNPNNPKKSEPKIFNEEKFDNDVKDIIKSACGKMEKRLKIKDGYADMVETSAPMQEWEKTIIDIVSQEGIEGLIWVRDNLFKVVKQEKAKSYQEALATKEIDKEELVKTINTMSERYPEFLLKAILWDDGQIIINTGEEKPDYSH